MTNPTPTFVGRQAELAEALSALGAGHNLVVKGRPGIGKRTLLRQVRQRLGDDHICLCPSMTTPKAMVQDLAEQVHAAVGLLVPERLIAPRFRADVQRTGRVPWKRIRRSLLREPAGEVLNTMRASLRDRADVVLFVESLEVAPTQAAMLNRLAEQVRIAAAMDADNRRARIQRLLWRFQRTIELGPLTKAESRQIVERWLEAHPLQFDGPKVRAAFVAAVGRDAAGVPAAIEGMLQAATNDREVTRARIRAYRHEAAAVYWDTTLLLIVALFAFMAMRYISRGIGMQELFVLAGVGTSLFWVVVFFARRMSGR